METTFSKSKTTIGCVNAAVAILGNKWTPLIIKNLAEKTCRFCELQDKVGGVNPRTLSARLVELEDKHIISKNTFPEVPPRTEYTLTDKGRALIPILEHMAEWDKQYSC
jgi:DNA-binding HxlR family transcriptional regulator